MDPAIKAEIDAAIAAAVQNAFAAVGQRLTDLSAQVDKLATAVAALPAPVDVSDLRDGMSRLASEVAMLADPGDDETADARNAHVDFVLAKYYSGPNDRPADAPAERG